MKNSTKGWASLATRKLFEAADMGDVCEDVRPHTHKGVPLVVSQYHPWATSGRNNYDMPTDDAQIAVMDFLTNNQDRHSGNIMAVDGRPLAIDHERNFQYFDNKFGSSSQKQFERLQQLHQPLCG